MTFDRDEQFLHEKLSADLHPAPVDLWPAVAENLPAKPHRRHLWLCLAAPLLIAAGVAATGAQFTDLRTNPRPSFAPDATAGYAISYERQYYTLPADLWAGMQANHDLETAEDGTLPMSGHFDGYLYLTGSDGRTTYSNASRGYESWSAMAEATGLPLPENPVLDAGEEERSRSNKPAVYRRRILCWTPVKKNLPYGCTARSSPRMAIGPMSPPPKSALFPLAKMPLKNCALSGWII